MTRSMETNVTEFEKASLKEPLFAPIYALVKIETAEEDVEIDQVQVQIVLQHSLNQLFGEVGMIGAVPKLLRYDAEKRLIYLQSDQENIDKLRQALCLTDGRSSSVKTQMAFKILNVTRFLTCLSVNSRNDFF